MSKATPGPWAKRWSSFDQAYEVYPTRDGPPDHGEWAPVAMIPHYGDGDDLQESEANARLIAAAPDLLAQHNTNLVDLDLLRRAITEGDPKAELLVRVDDLIRFSRDAIAKAE